MHFEATFTPTTEEMLAGYRMHNHRGQVSRPFIAGMCAGMLVVLACLAYWSQAVTLFFIGAAGGAGLLLAFLAPDWLIRRAIAKAKKEEVAFVVSGEGVEVTVSGCSARFTWDLIVKAMVDEHGVLLYTSPIQWWFIPARAFRHSFAHDELRGFLSRKIGNA